MNEIEIVRLNVERYRRMLQSELDETVRRTVEALLAESEAALLRTDARPTLGD